MQRKWKKASAVALTGALMASQALMASAAGGSIDAEMSTKTPVIRVVVPTKMEVAVNEFMMGDAGSQITSQPFTMKNVSEIPVNVEVTSTATLGTGVTLVSTKQAAQDSTGTEMWLAAAAAVKDASGTLEYVVSEDAAADKTVAALTGTEANVTAFETKEGATTAVQDFYLGAATTPVYEGIIGNETGDIGNGADYYELTAATPATDDAAGVAKLAETQDVYIAAGAIAAGTPQELTKVTKGTAAAGITWTASTSKAFTIGDTPVAYDTVKADNTKSYLYIKSAASATGDAAAFRYAGALSSAKSGWSTTDLSAIEIAYDITGITTSAYNEMKDDLVYGYMGEAEEESRISITASGLMTVQGLSGDTYKSGTVTLNGTEYAIDATSGRWTDATEPAKFQFSSTWTNSIKGKSVDVEITLKDDTTISETIEVPEN